MENQTFESAESLQKQVDADWQELNAACPSRARGCGGQPPLTAHLEWEVELFDLKRVDAYLAEFTWLRICTSVGQLRMRKVRYSLGAAWAHQEVAVTYDPEQRQFVFTQVRSETRKGQERPQLEPVRRAAKNLSVEDITGLSEALPDLPTRQLMFPLFISQPQANFPIQGA